MRFNSNSEVNHSQDLLGWSSSMLSGARRMISTPLFFSVTPSINIMSWKCVFAIYILIHWVVVINNSWQCTFTSRLELLFIHTCMCFPRYDKKLQALYVSIVLPFNKALNLEAGGHWKSSWHWMKCGRKKLYTWFKDYNLLAILGNCIANHKGSVLAIKTN